MNPICPKCGKLINDLRSSRIEAEDMFGKEEPIPLVAYACTNGCNTVVGVTVDPTWLVDQIVQRLR
jgi:hypothetical protein